MAASKLSLTNAQIPSVCHLCEDNKPIQWKCIDCNLLLCNTCKVKVHSKFRSADTHDVISLRDIGKEQKGNRSAPNIICKAHPGHQVCLYCINCDAVACPNCVSESHTKHHLESIGKIHDDIVGRITYIKDELTADLRVYMEKKTKLDKEDTADKQKFETTKSDVLRHFEKIKRIVDEERDQLLVRLEMNRRDLETANKTERSTILRGQEDIRSKISAAKNVLDKNDIVSCVRYEKSISSEWKHMQKCINKRSEIELLKFSPGTVDKQGLQKMIGNMQRCKEHGSQFDILRSQNIDMGNITNLHACEDGQVFVCDEYYTHSMTKVLFKESDLHETQHFKDLRVFDITETDNHEYIVSFADKTYLKRIKASGTMEDYMDFSPWIPRALHFTLSGKLLVSGREDGDVFPLTENSDRKIVVMSGNGKRLHHFEYDNKKNRLFSFVFRIATLTNNDIGVIDIYGENWEGSIISIRYPNTMNWIYRGESKTKSFNPFKPTAIVPTDAGSIIVNDKDNHLLHILDIKGSLIRCIQTDDHGILLPEALAVDANNQLWIGCLDKENKRNAMLHIVKFSGF